MFSHEYGQYISVSLGLSYHLSWYTVRYMFFCVSFFFITLSTLALCFFVFNLVSGIEYIYLRPQFIYGVYWYSWLWSMDFCWAHTEAEFLDEIQTKVLRVFLLAIHSHLYSFALRFLFLQTHATSYNFYSSVTQLLSTVKENGREPDRKPNPLPSWFKKSRNLKSESPQDYAQKPQRNCTYVPEFGLCTHTIPNTSVIGITAS